MEIEISCSQWEGSACTQSALIFFLLSFGWGWQRIFFHFSFVPNMFLSSSQWVPIRLPICSQGSQCVPNSTSLESHMFCPKSSPSHLYRWAKGGSNLSFHRIFYFRRASIVSIFFFFAMGQSNWLIAKKKEVGRVRHIQRINMKQNMSYTYRDE